MPRGVMCDATGCINNRDGECDADEITLDYTGSCEVYEEKKEVDRS